MSESDGDGKKGGGNRRGWNTKRNRRKVTEEMEWKWQWRNGKGEKRWNGREDMGIKGREG